MASSSFRDSMNSLGWSRRADVPVSTTKQNGLLSSIKSFNPFGNEGSVRLPTTEGPAGAPLPAPTRREEDDAWFALSRWDRILIFAGCNLGALACFVICFVLLPIIVTKPTKFATLWSLGSALFLVSWTFMMGPWTYIQHLTSTPRLPFTATYFGSIALTLYFSLGRRSWVLTLITAIIQLVCLVWYLVSYFPMGSSGLRLASSFGARRAAAWMTS